MYMAQKARIEYQNQFGAWRYFTTVTASWPNIHNALERALSFQGCVGKARALDEEDGSVLDFQTD
jgi:hypothetical protein